MHPWNAPIFESLKQRSAQLPHALLLHGVRGIGKLALAEAFAQFLLCEADDPARRPCGVCEACRWYAAGNHPDLRRIEPEALSRHPPVELSEGESQATARRGKPSIEIKVEQVRALADFLNIGSHRGRLRVALVHPAEDMNVHAANSLLKGLEEPPAGAMFILVSHRPARLLPTIRSRCVAVPVPVPPRASSLPWLASQGVKQADRWLAYAGGAPLRALEHEGRREILDHLLQSLGRQEAPVLGGVDDRDEIEALVDALQKFALDRAFAGFGLAPKYGTRNAATPPSLRGAWLAYARRLGTDRALCRHPLNLRLFAESLLVGKPENHK